MTHGSCQSLLTKANEITRVLCLLAFHVIDTLPLAAILAQVASLEPNWLLLKYFFFREQNVVMDIGTIKPTVAHKFVVMDYGVYSPSETHGEGEFGGSSLGGRLSATPLLADKEGLTDLSATAIPTPMTDLSATAWVSPPPRPISRRRLSGG